jgi:hypothetical protein
MSDDKPTAETEPSAGALEIAKGAWMASGCEVDEVGWVDPARLAEREEAARKERDHEWTVMLGFVNDTFTPEYAGEVLAESHKATYESIASIQEASYREGYGAARELAVKMLRDSQRPIRVEDLVADLRALPTPERKR